MIPFVPCHERSRPKISKMLQKIAWAIVFEKSSSHYEVSLTLFTDEAPEIQIGVLSQHFHATKKKQQHLRTSPFRLKASVHSLHSSLSSAGNLKQAVSPDVCYDVGARESWTKDWQDERRRWKRIDMCKRWVLASPIDVKAAEKTDVASPKSRKHTWKPTIVNLMPTFASVCTTWRWCGPPSLHAWGQRRTIETVLPERNS